jgi:hypothetical protein
MDYMLQITALPEQQQADALELYKQLQKEFESHSPNYVKMDRLQYQLEEMLNKEIQGRG